MRTFAFFALAFATACAHREPPPLTTRHLIGGQVTFRAWGGAGICEAEPRFLLDELTAVNSALQRWLDRVRGDAPAAWPESRIAEATRSMDPLADLLREHTLNLEALGGCDFAESAGYPFVRRRGAELVSAVRERTQQLERVHAASRAARALEAWVRGLDAERTAARRSCPARAAAPVVFFGWRDEEGVTHWLFCDGASVEQPPNAEPVLLMGVEDPPRRRRYKDEQYLEAAKSFPAGRVSAPPGA